MAQQGDDLRSLMAKLLSSYHQLDDRSLLHKEDLDKIFVILEANNERITSQPPGLEKEELGKLLREIDVALRQWNAWWEQRQKSPAAKSKKKTMPAVSDCNPFKSRPEQQGDSSQPASVDPLLHRTIAILGVVGEVPLAAADVTTELYEWTTSYVDETEIFGWDEEATKVADALVGDGDGEQVILFRAAGIVGIHGSGKTVLAQKVFIHDKIKDAFPVRLWVCVGPPDHEDRACLLYRMLDNLGLDTNEVEAIVDSADVVKKADGAAGKERSMIGVLLFILHVSLHKTGHPYLIVFDDIRAHKGGDGGAAWYSNLTLPPPPESTEWYERLAYGLPKTRKSAVLVTCRGEDDARSMVRTGSVFRPPKLGTDNGWNLFKREYKKAKEQEKKEKEDKLYKELEEMKEDIVRKCLGLPVAIVEAAKGFAMLEYEPPRPGDEDRPGKGKAAAPDESETAAPPTTSSSIVQPDEARRQSSSSSANEEE